MFRNGAESELNTELIHQHSSFNLIIQLSMMLCCPPAAAGGTTAEVYQPVDVIRVSPAAVRVRVPVSSVDEGVFERSADVLRGQSGHGRHHVTRKLPDAQRPLVLTSPPVMFRPERTRSVHMNNTCL